MVGVRPHLLPHKPRTLVRVGRPQLPPGELGSVRLLECPANSPGQRWRARGRMRLWDYSRRDPRSGAYQAGQRIDLTAFAATAKQAESALRKVARDRLVAEAARVQLADDAQPLSPPLIELATERLESAGRTGELAP